MKKSSLTLALFFLLTAHLLAQWTWTDISPQYNQSGPFHIGCHAPNDSTIWTVPFWLDGTINPQFSVTTNGGETWTVDEPDLGDDALVPVLVFALDADTAWITTQQMPSGLYGTVAVTYDSGSSWMDLDIPYIGNEVPIAVHFYSAQEGIVIAQNFFTSSDYVHIYRTTDGGFSWESVGPELNSGEVMWLYNGESVMERVGDRLYIGTGLGRVLRSLDRGATWDVQEVGLGDRRGMNSVAFENELSGIIMSTYHLDSLNFEDRNGISLAAITQDGGLTWEPTGVPPLMEHIEFVPNSDGVYIGGSGYTGWPQYYVSRDRGNQWLEKGSPGMINIVFTNQNTGFATTFGLDNGVVKYTGTPFQYDDSILPESPWEGQAGAALPYANFVSNYINDFTIIDPNTVWAITRPSRPSGYAPYSLKTTDGGQTWETNVMNLSSGFRGNDIHAFDAQHAFATTKNNNEISRLMETVDGGETWTVNHLSVASGGLVHFFNEEEGLIINDDEIEITQDGGQTWTSPNSLPELEMGDIPDFAQDGIRSEAKGNSYWFCGFDSKIFLTNDKGQNWEVIETPATFLRLAMRDSLNGLAITTDAYNTPLYFDSTTVFQTEDGGVSWELLTTMSNDFTILNLEYVENSENSYVGSSIYNSSTTITTDGGQTWEIIDESFVPGVCHFIDEATGWMVKAWAYEGYGPVLYKWRGDPFPAMIVNAEESFNSAPTFEIYPSPFNNVLQLVFETYSLNPRVIEIYDLSGGQVFYTRENGKHITLGQLGDLPKGAYLLKVTEDKKMFTRKIIKQ